jgi:hypothetical protein
MVMTDMSLFSRAWRLLGAVVTMTTLAACGGAGAGAGGSASAGSTTEAASIQVLKSVPTLASANASSMTLTAIVKNAGNVGLKDQNVTFSTTDPGVRLEIVEGKTDSSGAASAKLTLSDGTNRTIPVTVSTGSVSVVENVVVAGTSVTVLGPTTVALNQAAEFSVTVRDSASNPIAGKSVTVTSASGNAITGLGATNAQGQLRFNVTGTRSGADTLTVTALGATASAAFTVSGNQLSFIGTPSEAVVNTPQTIRVTLIENSVPQSGRTITLTATRGTLSATTLTTDASGQASFAIQSPTAGQTEITATGPGGLATTARFEFVSVTPTKIELQASPPVVGANLVATSTNSSQLIAVVRDAQDNPVKNRRVNFNFVADPSNGRIEPGSAVTDSTGTASVAFVAGPTPTGTNAVRVLATVDGTGVSDDATLTVSRRELFVRLFTGNEIEKRDTTKNCMPWTALVTDSGGNPVANVAVQPTVVAVGFYKGRYELSGSQWVKASNAFCPSEDLDGNLMLDAGEDTNGDSRLTPGNIAAVSVISAGGRTGTDGFANMELCYGRDVSTWARVRLTVTATVVSGTEGVDEELFDLPGVAPDYTNPQAAPPGQRSRFGVTAACNSQD